MKQILFLFFTFCGICKLPAQPAAPGILTDSGTKKAAPPLPKISVRLSPNPVKNKLSIELEGFNPGTVRLQLFDWKGVLRRDETRRLFDGRDLVTMMFSLPPGIYFLIISQEGRSYKRKVVVS
jgi:hypothetical protein